MQTNVYITNAKHILFKVIYKLKRSTITLYLHLIFIVIVIEITKYI